MKSVCRVCKRYTEKGEWLHIKKENEIYTHIQMKYWFCNNCISSILKNGHSEFKNSGKEK